MKKGIIMKKYKTDWKTLKWVAERSPKMYADTIRMRNEGLLQALKKRDFNYSSNVGCPHCRICATCLWRLEFKANHTKFVPTPFNPCQMVLFGGVSLESVPIVSYRYNCEYLFASTSPRNIAKARRFLEAHIDWANKPWWGKKYKKSTD